MTLRDRPTCRMWRHFSVIAGCTRVPSSTGMPSAAQLRRTGMRGEPEALYDAHAARLYAYCWSLVGDQAAAAVADAFASTVQHPPRGDSVLWMYALARHAC